jgi:UDP-N-acetyl-D-mannosaminuronic acid transferase (WecB/TagA/CpsF family)
MMQHRRILGIDFYTGDASSAVDQIRKGGLLVVPAAPALIDLTTNRGYREALLNADLCIADSGFMVLLWNLLERDTLRRVSGLNYLRALLEEPDFRAGNRTFWIMPSQQSAMRNQRWLRRQGIELQNEDIYVAPRYGNHLNDPALLERLNERRPIHIVVALGGGTQERLGLYIKRHLDFHPAIHCVGAAIAFLSGDQVNIPVWADRIYLGWLFRCISRPVQYVPRYWGARKLFPLLLRYRSQLPMLDT